MRLEFCFKNWDWAYKKQTAKNRNWHVVGSNMGFKYLNLNVIYFEPNYEYMYENLIICNCLFNLQKIFRRKLRPLIVIMAICYTHANQASSNRSVGGKTSAQNVLDKRTLYMAKCNWALYNFLIICVVIYYVFTIFLTWSLSLIDT